MGEMQARYVRAEIYGRGGLERAIEVAVAGGGEPEALGAQQVEQARDARAVDGVGHRPVEHRREEPLQVVHLGLGSGSGLGLGLGLA